MDGCTVFTAAPARHASETISFLGQAVWRYHPETDAFELFAQGGGNPWTLSFDSRGRAFSGDNGGNSRGFHWVPGGRYEKNWPKHGPFTRPYSFGFIPNMDHEGYAARFAMTSVVYEEGRLPGYEGQLVSGMALTSRMQATRFLADGSTFRTVDTDALVTTADRSFRPVDTAVGPDGAIYIADWCDIRMDHTDPRDTWDKSCGRIWRLRAKDTGRCRRPWILLHAATLNSYRCWATPGSGTASRRGVSLANAEIARWFPNCGASPTTSAVSSRSRHSGRHTRFLRMDADWARQLLDHPDAAVRLWGLRLFTPTGSLTRSMRDKLVAVARSEPDAEVRSELANTAARLDPEMARAVLQELMRRQEDLADKHLPLRIWWALEVHITRDPDSVLNWVEEAGLWQAPMFTAHIAPRIARRLAADRGDATRFTRIDPDTNWKDYAQHPRVLMPGGKGNYTDWQTNYTAAVSDRNLTRTARLLQMAPVNLRDRLSADVTAALDQGAAAGTHSRAARHDPRSTERGPISRRGRGHGGARPGGVPDLLRTMSSDRRQRHGASRAATARVAVGARIGRSAHPNRAAGTEGTARDARDGRARRSAALRHPHLRAQGVGPFGRTGCR